MKAAKELREKLIALNDAYRKGEPQVSDLEYDHLVERLRELDPNDPFFKRGIVEEADSRMEKLPLPMFSLEKVKTLKGLRSWLQKMFEAGCRGVVATPKFDGISLLVQEDDEFYKAWTRGNGVEGQRSDSHFHIMGNVKPKSKSPFRYTWGEAIIKKVKFQHLRDEHEGFTYKNARNMVAGLFNSPIGYQSPFMPDVDFVRYGSDLKDDKSNVLWLLNSEFDNSSKFSTFYLEEILELNDEELNEFLDLELHDTFDKEYRIDGIVLEVDEYAVRERLGRLPNGNPAYAIAFKREEWCDTYQTRVLEIEVGIGKSGTMNPVIVVEPVEMEGATVSRVTGYNAAYLVDNHICEGAVIEITRSGDVIPKHLKTLEWNESEYERMMDEIVICPYCQQLMKWDENKVNLICPSEKCRGRVISELVYFFKTMGCEEFSEPTIRKMYDEGWETVVSIFEASLQQLQDLLGKSVGKTVFEQIGKILTDGAPAARYLTALNVFEGKIAEKTCQKIFDSISKSDSFKIWLGELNLADNQLCFERNIEKLVKIDGVGETTAVAFLRGCQKYIDVYRKELEFLPITYVQTPKVETPQGVDRMHVCMTGFRSKELEQALTSKGHVVLSGVTKECTVLVVNDLNSTSSKMEKAKKLGIRIVKREDFENEVLV